MAENVVGETIFLAIGLEILRIIVVTMLAVGGDPSLGIYALTIIGYSAIYLVIYICVFCVFQSEISHLHRGRIQKSLLLVNAIFSTIIEIVGIVLVCKIFQNPKGLALGLIGIMYIIFQLMCIGLYIIYHMRVKKYIKEGVYTEI